MLQPQMLELQCCPNVTNTQDRPNIAQGMQSGVYVAATQNIFSEYFSPTQVNTSHSLYHNLGPLSYLSMASDIE